MARISSPSSWRVDSISAGQIVSVKQIDGGPDLMLIDSEGTSIYMTMASAEMARAMVEATLPTTIEIEHFPEAGVSTVSIKDRRPVAEQAKSWGLLHETIAGWAKESAR